jgi:hypothetical protein
MSSILASILAIGWKPELRGILITIIAVTVFCGSVYLVLATNLGARLGFLVALTGLAGWMALLGLIWMIYGIGLKGPEPSWEAVPGRTVLQSPNALYQAGVLDQRVELPAESTHAEDAALMSDQLVAQGWATVPEEDPAFGQATAAVGEFLEETGAFAAGEYQAVAMFERGGDRYPKINDSLDFLAFRHEPHYALVEVAALEPTRTEPGRAPAPAVIDETRQRQYVFMIRDLGARRQPATVLFFGATIIFLTLCWLLHRRERILVANRSTSPVPVAGS